MTVFYPSISPRYTSVAFLMSNGESEGSSTKNRSPADRFCSAVDHLQKRNSRSRKRESKSILFGLMGNKGKKAEPTVKEPSERAQFYSARVCVTCAMCAYYTYTLDIIEKISPFSETFHSFCRRRAPVIQAKYARNR